MGEVLKINGVWVHDPSELEYGLQDLDGEAGAGRNQQGLMFRDRVAVKRKLTCKFPPMGSQDMATLLQSMDDEFFSIEFPDARTGKRETMTAYVGDRTAPMYTQHSGKWLWSGLSANFIER